MRTRINHPAGPGRRRASVIVIVMVTLLFAMTTLLAFMDKAAVDLMADQRAAVARRLRVEAYSALEVALAVLVDFREAGNGLRSQAEGWNDPLGFAGYTPGEGCTVEISWRTRAASSRCRRSTRRCSRTCSWGGAPRRMRRRSSPTR